MRGRHHDDAAYYHDILHSFVPSFVPSFLRSFFNLQSSPASQFEKDAKLKHGETKRNATQHNERNTKRMAARAVVAPLPQQTGQAKDGAPAETALLPEETQYASMMAGIVTVTFLETKSGGTALETVADMLRARLQEVARSNPWLCGHLQRDKPSHRFVFPGAQAAADTMVDRWFRVVTLSELSQVVSLQLP